MMSLLNNHNHYLVVIVNEKAAHRIETIDLVGEFGLLQLVSWRRQLPGTGIFADENHQRKF